MSNPESKATRQILVLSGGTGRTAEQVIRAALAQFPDHDVKVSVRAGIRTADQAIKWIREAAADGTAVCHSFVAPKLRYAVDTETRRMGVAAIDVLGPALSMMADHLDAVPRGRAGLLYQLHREQFDRIDAMDFTLAHDDGERLADLRKADVVLVGASRTSKSVTCFYLAFRGIHAANVPLLPDRPPPPELLKVKSRRVIGLTMNAAHLESIRQSRLERISHRAVPRYADLRDIQMELRQVRELMSENQWECIDVSYKATEEVADQIIEMLPRARRGRRK